MDAIYGDSLWLILKNRVDESKYKRNNIFHVNLKLEIWTFSMSIKHVYVNSQLKLGSVQVQVRLDKFVNDLLVIKLNIVLEIHL